MMDKKRLQLRLKAARKNSHMTQAEAAESINRHDSQIRAWEGGRIVPSLESLEKLAKAYGTTVYSLIEGVFD